METDRWTTFQLYIVDDDDTKRWPSDKANHSCENALYIIKVNNKKDLTSLYQVTSSYNAAPD